jgi:hypothetical protein
MTTITNQDLNGELLTVTPDFSPELSVGAFPSGFWAGGRFV